MATTAAKSKEEDASSTIREEYLVSLADLDQNSKPMIDMLTMLAVDHRQHAPIIVDAIKQQISQVRAQQKLPLLYLIDSIVKNVGEEYKHLFQQEIVPIFTDVFLKVRNEKIREKMFALRETWNDVFLPTKLYTLDMKVNQIDPNWPIMAKATPKNPKIHVNPNFLKKIEPVDPIEQLKQEVLEKQRKLLELQKCKLELEMRDTAKKIEEEQRKRGLLDGAPATAATASFGGPPAAGSAKTVKVAPVSSALMGTVKAAGGAKVRVSHSSKEKKSPTEGAKSSSASPKKASGSSSSTSKTSPKSSSKSSSSKSSSSHRSSSSSKRSEGDHHHSSSGSKERKKSSKRSSDDSAEKSPTKRSRTSGAKAGGGALMPPKPIMGFGGGDTDDRIAGPLAAMGAADGAATTTTTTTANNQKPFLGAAAMDVDLRQFVALPTARQMEMEIGAALAEEAPGEAANKGDKDERGSRTAGTDTKKKHSSGGEDSSDGEPRFSKKSKKLDLLFGSNDVDLRALSGVGGGGNLKGPPVGGPNASHRAGQNEKEVTAGWSRIKGDTPKRGAAPKSNFDAIKNRILEASKAKQKRFDERIIARQPLQDVDLRNPKPLPVDDTSQDALDNSIQIIMAQAQEQLDNQAITPDQYNNMVQQVIQLNETNKIKEAERREKRDSEGTDARFSSTDSDSEEDSRDFRRKKVERRSHFVNRQQMSQPAAEGEGALKGAPHAFNNINNGPSMNPNRVDPRKRPWEQQQQHGNMNMNMNRPPGNWRAGMPPPFGNRPPQWVNNNNNGGGGGGPGGRFMGPSRFNNINNRMPMFNNGPPHNGNNNANIINNNPLLQMANSGGGGGAPRDTQLTIKIDNVNREILYYDDIALVFMDWDQPKEIGFQPGQRRITCDDQWSITLSFNAPNVQWMIDGRAHQVRLGAPTRELYIDNQWYECYIGDPCRIELDGKVRTIIIDGPPPQVRIGDMRRDLVAGKINIIVDAKVLVPVYLDAREQQFEMGGQLHTLQFADYFSTVLINKEPVAVEFGGLPKSFFVNGQKHFMRFTALPPDVVPGKFYVRGMVRTLDRRHVPSPPPPLNMILPTMHGGLMSQPPPSLMLPPQLPNLQSIPPPPIAPNKLLSNGLDLLTNILPGLGPQMNPLRSPDVERTEPPRAMGYNLENDHSKAAGSSAAGGGDGNPLGNVNIKDLFQKLLATGILAKPQEENNSSQEGSKAKKETKEAGGGGKSSEQADSAKNKKEEEATKNAPILTKERIVPVDLLKPNTIKKRQLAIVQQVYFGMQCSSCGVRFPPEQTMKYSQHLDWHFRQNRRDRDSVRKAHSRKWFYDVNNWIQYEEIEDLEEREKNWFETQQSELDPNQDEANHNGEPGVMPSCPAGSIEGEKICEVCHEPFDQFYNEETEEWHLRPAVRVEELIYHPICYEDYKLSLTMASMDESGAVSEAEEKDSKGAVIKTEEKNEDGADSKILDQSADNDDDVIVLPNDTQVITEILDDDEEEEQLGGSAQAEEASAAACDKKDPNESQGSDVEIQERFIPTATLDDDTSNITMPLPGVVRIKTEPKDDDNEEDAFMDVGTIEPVDETMEEEGAEENGTGGQEGSASGVPNAAAIEEESSILTVDTSEGNRQSPETIALDSPLTPAQASLGGPPPHEQLGMDGNVEENAPVVTIAPNKIRINISKLTSAAVHAEGNTDSRDSGAQGESSGDAAKEPKRPVSPELEIEFEFKDTMKSVNFQKMGKVANGVETSGLCSIM